jgi:fatty-acid desaturase
MTVANSTVKPPINWPTSVFMVVIHALTLLAFIPGNTTWAAVGVAIVLHWFTGCLGITLGWHRLIAHRSFQVPKWLEYFFVFCGSLACQHGPIDWIGLHRHHHRFSDQAVDHHNSGEGFWWSHMGWIFRDVPSLIDVDRFTRDIANDPVYLFFNRYFFPLQFLLAVGLYALGGWPFVVWGVFVRLVVVYHCTWLVNSATHKFGYRTYTTEDASTNCWWVAVLTYGEGWHNNHHAFQHSARHGLKWWEIDLTWMHIRLLKALGLAKKVKLVNSES